MKIDAKEIEQLAAAQPRLDLYSGIHKALRACMADALLALGRADLDDEQDLGQATERVAGLLELCASHLEHENAHVHAAMEVRAPASSAAVAHDHVEHASHIAALGGLVDDLRKARPAARPLVAQHLYRELALFMAENFRHMHVEETAHNAVLWARYTDAELEAIHDGLIASIAPDQLMRYARWLVPFLNPAERLGLLSDMRAKAPAGAFEAILDSVQPHLRPQDWARLGRELGRPVVPGLVEA